MLQGRPELNQPRPDRNDGNSETLKANALNILTAPDLVACETEANRFDKIQISA